MASFSALALLSVGNHIASLFISTKERKEEGYKHSKNRMAINRNEGKEFAKPENTKKRCAALHCLYKFFCAALLLAGCCLRAFGPLFFVLSVYSQPSLFMFIYEAIQGAGNEDLCFVSCPQDGHKQKGKKKAINRQDTRTPKPAC